MARKVLILDDDDRFRTQLRGALEAVGMTVIEAAKGGVATRALARHELHLAVVDGLLPDGNGFDWIARLRGEGNQLPVVFVSAFWRDLESYIRLTQQLDVALVMHKPLDVDRLAERIEVLLRKRAPKSSRPPMAAARPPDDLQSAYTAQLPAQLATLAAALERYEVAPGDADVHSALRTIAHELRGTASSFGHHDVGDLAGRIEDGLVSASSLPPEIGPMLQTIRAGSDRVLTPAIPMEGREPDGDAARPTAAIVARPRVLFVDDDTMFLEHAIDTAEAHLMDLRVAGSFEAALGIVEAERPDVALVGLPLGDPDRSAELIERLRARHPEIPVGVVALDDALPARIAAAEAGAALFLSHPVDTEALAHAVSMLRRAAEGEGLIRVVAVTADDVTTARLDSLEQVDMLLECCDADAMLRTLERVKPDVVILDEQVGEHEGVVLCRVLRAASRFREVPILLLAKTTREADRKGALAAGADDCLCKLDPPGTWAQRIRIGARAARRRIGSIADVVTRLPGRHRILADLGARLSEAKRYQRPFAVALFDMENLAAINAEHGRAAGDRALGALANLLQARFRAEDVRGRLGPDELVVGLVDSDATVADAIERTRDGFSKLELRAPSGDTFASSFSLGVASYPADGDNIARLLSVAEGRLAVDRARGGAAKTDEEPEAPTDSSAESDDDAPTLVKKKRSGRKKR